MFSKFTTILHNAVEALGQDQAPMREDFVFHWKAITHHFVNNKDTKVAVEQTNIPSHLRQMLDLLLQEESAIESGISGPCMEYLLQHKILETLYTLGRTDCPPGMKQEVLSFFTQLLSKVRQPLLPHVNVHRAVHRLVKVCGEIRASPSENEEIQFLCTVCAKIKSAPYTVNFFLESLKSQKQDIRTMTEQPQIDFALMESLLALTRSEDSRVAIKACEGLLLCASLPEESSAKAIIENTKFCTEITEKLTRLYSLLPKTLDPGDVESLYEANWGLDVMTDTDEFITFPGKRQLTSFLSWLDYCDQLIMMAHPFVAKQLSVVIHQQFLVKHIEPSVLQTNESGAITSTCLLTRCLRLVSSSSLLTQFALFILGEDRDPEFKDDTTQSHKFRMRLIERCDHLSEELTLVTLKLFETLLLKPDEHIFHNLILRNLLTRNYCIDSKSTGEKTAEEASNQSSVSESANQNTDSQTNQIEADKTNIAEADSVKENSETEDGSESSAVEKDSNTSKQDERTEESTTNEGESAVIEGDNVVAEQSEESDKANEIVGEQQDVENTSENVDTSQISGIIIDGSQDVVPTPDTPGSELDFNSLGFVPTSEESSNKPGVHKVVNCFLSLVPDECKSSYQMSDSGYDTYLRDAHRQYTEMTNQCLGFNWPLDPVSIKTDKTDQFFEGTFLNVILNKLSHIMDQSYDINLQVTSVVSKLAQLPHPNLHEYLLDPFLNLSPDTRTMYTVFTKVITDLKSRQKSIPDFNRKLLQVRRQLIGLQNNLKSIEGSSTLEGVIVLEEFCKELAAIAFVKHTVHETQ
ncbi:unnamed protein product [Owenia fusiformis]|uniref:FHF complex subunit HOOK-interacting protein C-terminal domain-containing protein n=1 Tax=Owenia fusiformis TaxID=6347 RepID=A0A8S4NP84_OWEFU|nr:unnamed protein product [Owenia fusiformis]